MMQALMAAMGNSMRPVTVNANWGSDSTNSPATSVTSATRTISAGPGGGTIRFDGVSTSGASLTYSKNGAGAVAITEDLTVAVVNGDTFAFTFTGGAPAAASFTVLDNLYGTSVGNWTAAINP
jgi:hypothetical protein